MNHNVKLALDFATKAHNGQYRKNSGLDYIVHPISVMNKFKELIVPTLDVTDEYINILLSACLCHDVIEDTKYKNLGDFIDNGLSPTVFYLVEELTDTSKNLYPFFNRKDQKLLNGVRMNNCSRSAQLIKVCDILCNCEDYTKEDPSHAASVYIPEKQYYMKFLTKLPTDIKNLVESHLDKLYSKSIINATSQIL